MPPALHGLLSGLALIVAIGAQNVFVLRQGLRREHVLAVVAVCTLSDMVLIAAGAAGAGAVISGSPLLVTLARWGGAAFLLVYAAGAARRALRGGESLDTAGTPGGSAARDGGLRATVLTALALTWLNPHVYLDTVLLLGTMASTHGTLAWQFALGAMAGSTVWFTALGLGARRLGGVLGSARSWRVLDGAIALVMVLIAVSLLRG
ncbi:LysE/ArgO family amino acid transporter [Brachybacterium aquaticum]|uniref:L-lysine exporter family protein LysE/ArgO n=1 Tax=Brachybacterium aquaticum TaxID=1432564 RepID=A0A841ABD2_9MICO|nr:LysE/ArgO family amino acid transporter [Brachybacterium aquaticum]MBB5831257.1 L-lysine exporter family protein LysE/ArgO [Brachybacterium aquaticum]